jgi:outer membrane lipoprotein LolB
MKLILQTLILTLLGLFIVACSTLPATNTPLNQNLTWPTRQAELQQLQSWKISGLLSVRDNQQSQSANVSWVQKEGDYTISIFGPLGFGGLILEGQPGIVTLKEDNGQKFSASTPEELITETSHWVLPVSNLYFWIRGIPAPNSPAQLQFDRYHHLQTLNQQGWKISYQKYTGIKNMDLPSLITLSRPPLFIKIVISQWEIVPVN